MHLPHRPSHGVIAGYAGLLLGTLAVAGGPAFAAGLINGHNLKTGTVTSAKLAQGVGDAGEDQVWRCHETKLGNTAVTAAAIAPGADDAPGSDPLGLVDLSVAARARARRRPGGSRVGSSARTSPTVRYDEKLALGGVGTAAIADGAITTAKLADGAATGSKLPTARVVGSTPAQWCRRPVARVRSAFVALAVCPVGEQALGGGVAVDLTARPFPVGRIVPAVTVSAPIFGHDNVPTGWSG